jgi:hypothetical protein
MAHRPDRRCRGGAPPDFHFPFVGGKVPPDNIHPSEGHMTRTAQKLLGLAALLAGLLISNPASAQSLPAMQVTVATFGAASSSPCIASPLLNRTQLQILNNSTSTLYFGPAATMTSSTGAYLGAGSTTPFMPYWYQGVTPYTGGFYGPPTTYGQLWCWQSATTTGDIRFIEIR